MINPYTWFVLSLLASAMQVAEVVRSGNFDYMGIIAAIVLGLIIGGFWSFVSGWARGRFFKNLTDNHVNKIRWGLFALGIFLVGSIIYHAH
jgi:hypothetical protein